LLSQELHSALKNVQGELTQYSHVNSMHVADPAVYNIAGDCLLQELHSALKKVQGELARYSHVNKKALDQFVNFTEQRQELTRRVDEVTQSGES
jgi:chromosome segregation ATPase